MQTIANQELSRKEIIDLERLHLEAQTAAQGSVESAAKAIGIARQIGSKLASWSAEFKTANQFRIEVKKTFSPELFQWHEQYLKAAQLELPLQFQEASPSAFRQALLLLGIVPMVERGAADHSDDNGKFERSTIKSIETTQKFLAQVPRNEWPKYRVQLTQLYSALQVFFQES